MAVTDPARRSVERRLAEAEGHTSGLVRTTRRSLAGYYKKRRTRNCGYRGRYQRLMMRLMNRAEPIETRHRKKRARSKCVWSRMTLATPRTAVSACSRRRRGWIRGTSSARRTSESASASVPAVVGPDRLVFLATARSPSPRRRAARVPCRRLRPGVPRRRRRARKRSSAESRRRGAGGPSCPRRSRAWLKCCLAVTDSDKSSPALHRRWGGFRRGRTRAARRDRGGGESLRDTTARTPRGTLSPGAVLEATCAVLGNAFAVKSPSARRNLFFQPDPRSAEISAARVRAALVTMSQKPIRNLEPYLDAWFVLSEEAETVALATFPETSRLNHSCDRTTPRPPPSFAGARRPIREGLAKNGGRRYSSPPVVRATTRVTRRCAQTVASSSACRTGRWSGVRTETSAAESVVVVARVHLRACGVPPRRRRCGRRRRRAARTSPPSTTTTWPPLGRRPGLARARVRVVV